MGYGRREVRNDGRKLNLVKVFITLIVLILVIVSIVFLVKSLKNDKNNNDINEENEKIAEAENENAEPKKEYKTIEDMLAEFGGEIESQVNQNTYYVKKDGKTYTAYVNDEIVEGKITPWTGEAKQPPVDEAGNINIYTAEELKWIADQVITGEKNFSGVTITLRQHIDLGARKKDDGTWEGPKWTSIIGFLDELPQKEGQANNQPENTVVDETVETINENLKRFAGIFDGNGYSIRGLYIDTNKRYQGLFGLSTGIIKNVEIKDSCLKGGTGTGAIVGLNGGKILSSRITNTEIKGASKVGGIAGICMTSSWIETCTTSETSIISGGDYTGGIAGYVNNNSAIIQCENEATISGNDYVGGTAGIIFYGSILKDSTNRSNCIVGEKYVGGISGYSSAQIEKCTNMNLNKNGYVKGKEYVGGIVGINYLMGDITLSTNKAKIVIQKDNGGGISGLNNSSISNCYNSGAIDASDSEGAKIGGISGQNASESFINSCYNIGNITFKTNADGVVGADFGSITNCYYLDSSIKNKNDKYLKNEVDLKNIILSEFGEYYKSDENNINLGYPILNWE